MDTGLPASSWPPRPAGRSLPPAPFGAPPAVPVMAVPAGTVPVMAVPAVASQPIVVPATKRPGEALPTKAAPAKARTMPATVFPTDLRGDSVHRVRHTPGAPDIVYGVATAVQQPALVAVPTAGGPPTLWGG
eukprot:4930967-Heterocapsa_arctica.AAC.1